MDRSTMLPFVLGMGLVVLPSCLGLALWIVLRLSRRADRPLAPDMTGAVAVPVLRLTRTFGLIGSSRNDLGPRLAVAPDGLLFRVFRADRWPFAEIVEVDLPPRLLATRIAVRHRAGTFLYIDVAGEARARDLLRILPPDLPLTPRAAALRDGTG